MNLANPKSLKKSRGFTLIELVVVLGIIAVAGALALPKIRDMMTSVKVDPTAKDLMMTAAKVRTANAGGGVAPYAAMGAAANATAVFANSARGLASSLTITGAGATATIQHDLGATGSQVTVVPTTITVAGDAFTVTLPTVNHAACPDLAAQLAKAAEAISINGTVVKAVGGLFNGANAQNLCTQDDTNTFVFTFR